MKSVQDAATATPQRFTTKSNVLHKTSLLSHTNKEIAFGFMKLSNNVPVGLEIEMLLHFPQFASDTKFMSKLYFRDTYWEYELPLSCDLHYTQYS